MYLTSRTAALSVTGVLLAVLLPDPRTPLVWTAAVLLLALLDVGAAASPRHVAATRTVDGPCRLGQDVTTRLTLSSRSQRSMRLRVRDAWPPSAHARTSPSHVRLAPGGRAEVVTYLAPTRRGTRQAGPVTLRSVGPLGLGGRQASLEAPASVSVLPAFASRRYLPSRLARLHEMDGRSAAQVRGAGTELDSLRGYVLGDDVRSIDWRSTARRHEVLVRTWQPERDRRVVIVLATDRLAAARTEEGTRLDAYIDVVLLLADLVTAAGDRIEVIVADERVRARLVPSPSVPASSWLARALAETEPRLTVTSWPVVRTAVEQALSGSRGLVVVLAGTATGVVDADQALELAALARRHRVVLAHLEDPDLERVRSRRDTVTQVYAAAAAERDLLELAATRAVVEGAGVTVVAAAPGLLAARVSDVYLTAKQEGRL